MIGVIADCGIYDEYIYKCDKKQLVNDATASFLLFERK